eukprot:4606697-Alexandrium_andersonii.AAC.1
MSAADPAHTARLREGCSHTISAILALNTPGELIALPCDPADDRHEKITTEALEQNYNALVPWIVDGAVLNPNLTTLRLAFKALDDETEKKLSGALSGPLQMHWVSVLLSEVGGGGGILI